MLLLVVICMVILYGQPSPDSNPTKKDADPLSPEEVLENDEKEAARKERVTSLASLVYLAKYIGLIIFAN